MQIFLAIVNKNVYIRSNKLLVTMVYEISQEEWNVLGDMVGATKHLQASLEERGYTVINTLETGIHRAELVFIVEFEGTKLFSFVSFDVLKEQERLKAELFCKGDELLSVDRVAVEKQILRERLAALEERHPANGCR